MLSKELHSKIHFYLSLAIAFTIPFGRFTPIFIVLIFSNWLLEADFKNKMNALFKNKLMLLFISFYLLHVFGLIYTKDISSGLFDIQVKMSLIIFPLIFVHRENNLVQFQKIFNAFLFGTILSSLIILIISCLLYIVAGAKRFFYTDFSYLIHPGYLSMYINFILIGLFLMLFKNILFYSKIKIFWIITIIVFLSFINILLSSKMGLFSMILLFLGFLVYYVFSRRQYFIGLVGVLGLIFMVFLSLKLFPELSARINRSIISITETQTDLTATESTSVRLLIFGAANKIISNHTLIGVGTGDVINELIREYHIRGMKGAEELRLNAHSVFYQVFIALGIVGFLLLLLNLFIPIRQAFKFKGHIYVLFLGLILLNFLTESMLNTQAGVIFYAFFNTLLCLSFIKPNTTIKHLKNK